MKTDTVQTQQLGNKANQGGEAWNTASQILFNNQEIITWHFNAPLSF